MTQGLKIPVLRGLLRVFIFPKDLPDRKKQRTSERGGAAQNTAEREYNDRLETMKSRMAELKEMNEQPACDKKAIEAEGVQILETMMKMSSEYLISSGLAGVVPDGKEVGGEVRGDVDGEVEEEVEGEVEREVEGEVEEETPLEKYCREREEKIIAEQEAIRLAILRGLPSLINTKTGIMGCTIAKYKEQSVAVISLPIVECFFDAQEEGIWEILGDTDVRKFFGRAPGCVPDKALSEVEVDFRGVDFRDMILQTPLRAAHLYQEKRNKKRFFVATADSWRGILDDFALPQVSGTAVEFSLPRSLKSKRSVVKRLKRAKLPEDLVKFFEIPEELVGKVHVVNSMVEGI